jgi:hypothetical protein
MSPALAAPPCPMVSIFLDVYLHLHRRGALVEQALLHHLKALREIPADLIIPPRIEVTEASFAAVTELLIAPRAPTKAMRALMAKSKS